MLGSELETGPAANVKRLSWILTLPLIIVIVGFTVFNLEPITLDRWPFALTTPPVPLSMALLGGLFFGLLIGGLATWLSAGRMRRRGRRARRRVEELEREVARLRQERERATSATPAAAEGGHAGLPGAAAGAVDDPGHDKRSALSR